MCVLVSDVVVRVAASKGDVEGRTIAENRQRKKKVSVRVVLVKRYNTLDLRAKY